MTADTTYCHRSNICKNYQPYVCDELCSFEPDIQSVPSLSTTREELAELVQAARQKSNDDCNAISSRLTDLEIAIWEKRQAISRMQQEVEQLHQARIKARQELRSKSYALSAWLAAIRDRFPADRLPDNIFMFKLVKMKLK